MTNLDEAEYLRLQTAINDAEKAFAKQDQHSAVNLGAEINGKKSRVQSLEQSGIFGNEPNDRRKSEASTAFAIAAMVAKETKLTHQEKTIYAEFLHQEHFTKKNFEALEGFYQNSWDRLSTEGKREMSQRFWLGVEQGEYRFEEAPQSVRSKEAEQLAHYTRHPEEAPDVIKRMTPETKRAFLEAHETGDHATTNEILSRNDLFEKDIEGLSQASSEHSDEAASLDQKTSLEDSAYSTKNMETLAENQPIKDELSQLGDFSISMTALPKQSGESLELGS